MQSSIKNYGLRTNGKEHGVVYTNPAVVRVMLNTVGYTADKNLRGVTVLDPAAGDGVFIFEVLERLLESSRREHFSFESALNNIVAFEIDSYVADKLKERLIEYLTRKGVASSDTYASRIIRTGDFLTSTEQGQEYDLIVGNPPYIRHEQIPEEKRKTYRELYSTFKYRSDIYIAFFEKSLSLLSTNGMLCFICSNRWTKAKYGEALRSLIADRYGIKAIIDIEDQDAFAEKVDAYASIFVISAQKTSSYDRMSIEPGNNALVAPTMITNVSSPRGDAWFTHASWEEGQDDLALIEEQGFKIGIGVATGADKIYIGHNLPIEEELLVPIALARDISSGALRWSGSKLFNPYHPNGQGFINLEEYPLARAYLQKHYDALSQRHTAKQNPSKWYKTIDRVYPALTSTPKLLIPDMKRDRLFALDMGDYYPHHNLYYIVGPDVESLKIMGALLSTEFVNEQVRAASVAMRGGYARWQSQSLRKIRLPIIEALPSVVKAKLCRAFDTRNSSLAQQTLAEIIGSSRAKPPGEESSPLASLFPLSAY